MSKEITYAPMAKTPISAAQKERGKRIKAARNKAKLTQSKLADALVQRGFSITASAIGNWEQGTREPPIEPLLAIAEICDTVTSILLALPEAPTDRRQGQINILYNKTDERGKDAIWRIAESQPDSTVSRKLRNTS